MRELTIDEAKKLELDILLHIDKFCRDNGKRYFLAYGTLIGAIRHKGFIPWDDDVDINMPREDYEWLIENYNKMNPGGRYRLISPYAKESKHSFVKFIDTYTVKIEPGIDYKDGDLGIDVDIFPLDGEPEADAEFSKWFDKLMKVYRVHSFCIMDAKKGSLKRRLAVPIIRLLSGGKNGALKKAAKLHAKYPFGSSKYIGVVECLFINKGDRFEKECYENSIEAEFEGYKFFAPAGYDKVLTGIYGDYMKLPPPEKRVTHHTNKMYLKEEHELK